MASATCMSECINLLLIERPSFDNFWFGWLAGWVVLALAIWVVPRDYDSDDGYDGYDDRRPKAPYSDDYDDGYDDSGYDGHGLDRSLL